MRWAIISGEYPPQPGGVSDYTYLVARELARAGDEVFVWAPAVSGSTPHMPGVQVRRLSRHFGLGALAELGRDLDRLPRPFQIVVQYVPHAFGYKAMNVPFAAWLFARRRERPWVMFHEVSFDLKRGQPLRHNVLGLVTNSMAALVARAAEHCFVAIPEWETRLRKVAPGTRNIHLLPVPSNVPTRVDPCQVAAARNRLALGGATTVIGHFGTFGDHVAPLVREVLPQVLAAEPLRIGALLGRGGREFAAELVGDRPDLRGRVVATGGLPPDSLAAHLAACDLLIQPYPDGASSRRGSLMAGMGLGLPIVTTDGLFTEPQWRDSGAVALAPAANAGRMIDLADALLRDSRAREQLRASASALYARRFALENTIHALRSTAEEGAPSV